MTLEWKQKEYKTERVVSESMINLTIERGQEAGWKPYNIIPFYEGEDHEFPHFLIMFEK